jgi:hypothetical protein
LVTGDAGECRWEILQNGRTRMASDQAFRTTREAKANVRAVLLERLTELAYAAPPAHTDT